jgi:cytochrome P450
MRFESPVPSGARYAKDDIDLGDGLTIKGGDAIHAFWSAANVDPTFYDDPLTVDFKRTRTNHIVFASGTHRCLGSHLARLELRVAVEEILNHIPDFETQAGQALTYDNVAVRTITYLPVTFTPTGPSVTGRRPSSVDSRQGMTINNLSHSSTI